MFLFINMLSLQHVLSLHTGLILLFQLLFPIIGAHQEVPGEENCCGGKSQSQDRRQEERSERHQEGKQAEGCQGTEEGEGGRHRRRRCQGRRGGNRRSEFIHGRWVVGQRWAEAGKRYKRDEAGVLDWWWLPGPIQFLLSIGCCPCCCAHLFEAKYR